MITAWTKHLKDQDEKERFQSAIVGSKMVLDRLAAMLQEVKDDLEQTELSLKNYSTPNWDYLQAETNGFKRCLKLVQKIINLDQKETNNG